MKIALCFSGLPRGNYAKNVELHQEAFGGDVFLNTWTGIECETKHRCNYWPEPKSDYLNPTVTHLESEYKRKILSRGYKQIMAHAYATIQLPKTYDVIVRCRYDVIPNKDIDWSEYVRECYENNTVVGVRFQIEDEWDYLKHVRPTGLVLDQMIMHKPEHLDPGHVINLYHHHLLEACEMGWYQVFSHNTIKNYIGGCKLDK